MSVYVIALITISDRDEYARYEAGFMPIWSEYRGELLAVDEDPEVLEGDWPHTRTVLLKFPSPEALEDWYRSDAYQQLMQHRIAASTGSIAMIRGFEAGGR